MDPTRFKQLRTQKVAYVKPLTVLHGVPQEVPAVTVDGRQFTLFSSISHKGEKVCLCNTPPRSLLQIPVSRFLP